QHIQRALESLDIELSMVMRIEKTKDPSIRSMMCGLIESVHLVLLQLTEERNKSKVSEDASKQAVEIPILTTYPLVEPKEEPVDVSIPDYNEMSAIYAPTFVDDDMRIKEEEISNVDDTPLLVPTSLIDPKEEAIDEFQSIPEYNEISAQHFMSDEMTIKEEEMMNDDVV
ncbi:hypothetical protein PENTCL1PPCAC_8267, partial [Pristionchus entomophagus]